MKKSILSVLCIAIACVGAVFYSSSIQKSKLSSDAFLMENVEALTNPDGVVITCSAGRSGKCFTRGYNMYYCGEYTYWSCVYTGYTNDYCFRPC